MGTVEYRDALRAVLDSVSPSTAVRLSVLHPDAIVEAVAEWIDPLIPRGTPVLRWEVVTPDGATDPIPVGTHDD